MYRRSAAKKPTPPVSSAALPSSTKPSPPKRKPYVLPKGPRGDTPSRSTKTMANHARAVQLRQERKTETNRANTTTRIQSNRRPAPQPAHKYADTNDNSRKIEQDIKRVYTHGESIRLKDKTDAAKRLRDQHIFAPLPKDDVPKPDVFAPYHHEQKASTYVKRGSGAFTEVKPDGSTENVKGNFINGKFFKKDKDALGAVGDGVKAIGTYLGGAEPGDTRKAVIQSSNKASGKPLTSGLTAPEQVQASLTNTAKHGLFSAGSSVAQGLDVPLANTEALLGKGLVATGAIKGDNAERIRKASIPGLRFRKKGDVSGGDITEGVGIGRAAGLGVDLALDPLMYAGVALAPESGGASLAYLVNRIEKVAPEIMRSEKGIAAVRSGNVGEVRKLMKTPEYRSAQQLRNKTIINRALRRSQFNKRTFKTSTGAMPNVPSREAIDMVEEAVRGAHAREASAQPRLQMMTPLGRRTVRGRRLPSIPLAPKAVGRIPVLRMSKVQREAAISGHVAREQAFLDTEHATRMKQLNRELEDARITKMGDQTAIRARIKTAEDDYRVRLAQVRDTAGKDALEKSWRSINDLQKARNDFKAVHAGRIAADEFGRLTERKFQQAFDDVFKLLPRGREAKRRAGERIQMYLNTAADNGGVGLKHLENTMGKLSPQEQVIADDLKVIYNAMLDHAQNTGVLKKGLADYSGYRIWENLDDPAAAKRLITDMTNRAGSSSFSRSRGVAAVTDYANPAQYAATIKRLSENPHFTSLPEAEQLRIANEAADKLHGLGKARTVTELLTRRIQRGEDVQWDDLTDTERYYAKAAMEGNGGLGPNDTPLFRNLDNTEGRLQLTEAGAREFNLPTTADIADQLTGDDAPVGFLLSRINDRDKLQAMMPEAIAHGSHYPNDLNVMLGRIEEQINTITPDGNPINFSDEAAATAPGADARTGEAPALEDSPTPEATTSEPPPPRELPPGPAEPKPEAGQNPIASESDVSTPPPPAGKKLDRNRMDAETYRKHENAIKDLYRRRDENGMLTPAEDRLRKQIEAKMEAHDLAGRQAAAPTPKPNLDREASVNKLQEAIDAKKAARKDIPTREELRERDYHGSKEHHADAKAAERDLESEVEEWGAAEKPTWRRPAEDDDLDQVEPAVWASKQQIDNQHPALVITAKDQDGQYHIYRWDPEDFDYHHVGADKTMKGAKEWAGKMAQEYGATVHGDLIRHRKWMAETFKDLPDPTLARIRKTPAERGTERVEGSPSTRPDGPGGLINDTGSTQSFIVKPPKVSAAQSARYKDVTSREVNPKIKRKFDVNGVDWAAREMGIQYPVKVHVVSGEPGGQYIGVIDGHHQIIVPDWVSPIEANKIVNEELLHAKQFERDPVGWHANMEAYSNLDSEGRKSHPWEVEAQAHGAPYDLAMGREVPDEPTTALERPNRAVGEPDEPAIDAEPVSEPSAAPGGSTPGEGVDKPPPPADGPPEPEFREVTDPTSQLPDFRSQAQMMVDLDPRRSAFTRARQQGLSTSYAARWSAIDKVVGRNMNDSRLVKTGGKTGEEGIYFDRGTGEEFISPRKAFENVLGVDEDKMAGRVWPMTSINALAQSTGSIQPYDQLYDSMLNSGVQQVLGAVRFGVTTPFPAYHIRNLISDLIKSMQADSGVIFHPIVNAKLTGLAFGKGKRLTFRVPGYGKMKGEDLLHVMDLMGVKNGYHAGEVMHLLQAGKAADENNIKSYLRKNPVTGWFMRGGSSTKFGANREDIARFQTFFQRLRANGGDSADAAWYMVKHHFNYNDLRPVEKRFVRNLFLFYTWYRKNIPLQLAEIMRRPGFFSGMLHTYHATESGESPLNVDIPGSPFSGAAPNQPALPDYVKNSTQAITVPWKAHAVNVGFGAPWSDLGWLSQDGMNQIMSLANPAASVIYQLASKKDTLTGRTYKKFEPNATAEALGAMGIPVHRNKKGQAEVPWFWNVLLRTAPGLGRGTSGFSPIPADRDPGRLSTLSRLTAPLHGLNVNVAPEPGGKREREAILRFLRGRAAGRTDLQGSMSAETEKTKAPILKRYDDETRRIAKQRGITPYLKEVRGIGFEKDGKTNMYLSQAKGRGKSGPTLGGSGSMGGVKLG